MTVKTVIGIDIGTQGVKAALFGENGRCLAQSFRASKLFQPKPGVVEEDPERQFTSVCQTVKACITESRTEPATVAAIGIDGQMAGVIGVGKDGRHVTPYDSWLDTRCAPYIKKMERGAGDEIVRKAGCPPSFNHGPKKLWWMHERKTAYRAIAAFVQPGAYAAMRLCGLDGRAAFIDTTYLHFSGFADNQNAAWDAGLCKRFTLSPEKLPTIVRPETIIGEVSLGAARKCGLKRGVPVVAGCGDTAASFLACGAVREGICVDVAGTASVFAGTTQVFRPDAKYRMLGCGRAATPGLWHPYAYINGGGMNLEWFRQTITERGEKPPTLERLNRLAERVKPTDDLPLFVPHLGGRVCPSQPDLRGAWIGLTWDHSLGHLYRAALEGVVLEYVIYQKKLKELNEDLRVAELRITGGGERSRLWNTIKADALQLPVRRIARSEGAPLGAALLAGYGVGLFRSLRTTANRWIAVGERIKPNRHLASYYAERAARYEVLLKKLAGA